MKAILKLIAVTGGLMITGLFHSVQASSFSYASYPVLPKDILEMKLSEFVKLSQKDFSFIAGKKLSFKERVSFMMMKKDMKKELKKTGNDRQVKDYLVSNTADKKDKTALIIAIIVVVVIVVAIIVAESVRNMDLGINWGS
jgi:hypothetical protein